ncbi:MAG: hypothetical protein K0S05_2379, partial [Agromyces sp.]|nr:hypothetical protein [Agromyces sp.]
SDSAMSAARRPGASETAIRGYPAPSSGPARGSELHVHDDGEVVGRPDPVDGFVEHGGIRRPDSGAPGTGPDEDMVDATVDLPHRLERRERQRGTQRDGPFVAARLGEEVARGGDPLELGAAPLRVEVREPGCRRGDAPRRTRGRPAADGRPRAACACVTRRSASGSGARPRVRRPPGRRARPERASAATRHRRRPSACRRAWRAARPGRSPRWPTPPAGRPGRVPWSRWSRRSLRHAAASRCRTATRHSTS